MVSRHGWYWDIGSKKYGTRYWMILDPTIQHMGEFLHHVYFVESQVNSSLWNSEFPSRRFAFPRLWARPMSPGASSEKGWNIGCFPMKTEGFLHELGPWAPSSVAFSWCNNSNPDAHHGAGIFTYIETPIASSSYVGKYIPAPWFASG